jgi:hypothetical protein
MDQARARHRAASYPGDLAADVLGEHARRSRWRIFLAGGVASAAAAVAACIAVAVFFHRPTPTTVPPVTVIAQEVNFVVPGKPDMPGGLPIVPPYQELTTIPAKPEFPSIFASL